MLALILSTILSAVR